MNSGIRNIEITSHFLIAAKTLVAVMIKLTVFCLSFCMSSWDGAHGKLDFETYLDVIMTVCFGETCTTAC